MTRYIAFLHGINVGGSTKLPMGELQALCVSIGLENVRTYIRSGNVLFESELSEEELAKKLEEALYGCKNKRIAVAIRSARELQSILIRNPFPEANPAQVGISFFAKKLPGNLLDDWPISGPEEVQIALREIYIHYPNGMGRSKLKFPKSAQEGTIRNINTIGKLVELSK